jgi:hypothetical protein
MVREGREGAWQGEGRQRRFVVRVEQVGLLGGAPVVSSLVRVEVGEEEGPSLWSLELVPGPSGVSACLWRRDRLPGALEVRLTVTASCPLPAHSATACGQVASRRGSPRGHRQGVSLAPFLPSPWPEGEALRLDCQLAVTGLRARKPSNPGGRVAFGPVEEVHYMERRARAPLWSRVARGVAGALGAVEAGSNKDPYMLLHAMANV